MHSSGKSNKVTDAKGKEAGGDVVSKTTTGGSDEKKQGNWFGIKEILGNDPLNNPR